MFHPGHPKWGGRKKGTKNKNTINYLDLQLWARMIIEGSADLESKELIELGFRGLALLLTKFQNLPGTAQDSVKNAEFAAQFLNSVDVKQIENATHTVNP